ncbi:MAG: TIGR02300 family protein [Pelagibacterium sp.]|uniref:TIGR02300 family protein n=1 Tax=Pelagibacterium sp. TaxID=1967288 RepID=UPI0032EE4AF6
MASDERGTKRTCPVTGKKFYDLGKDPVVSPYTGKSYPLSFFEAAQEKAAAKFGAKERKAEKVVEEEEVEEADVDVAAKEAGAEVISLNDAETDTDDDDDDDNGDNIPDVEDVEVDEELGGDDDDTFLEEDDDDDDIGIEVDVDDDER